MSTLLLKLTSNVSLRGMTSPDGIQVFSVYDFITLACQKTDGGAYARKTFSNLIKEGCEFRDEVVNNVLSLQFPGSGQRETPTMTIRGLQRLLMILGGKVATEFRTLAESTFTRVMAGDTSLIEVIKANAVSDAPVNQAFRQALAQEPIPPMLSDEERKRKAERDNMLFDLEIRERLSKVKDAEVARINTFANTMQMLNPDWKRDTRLRLSVEDSLKTTVLGGNMLAITDGSVPLTQSLSVGEVAQKMGYTLSHGDSVAIGRSVSRAYVLKHGSKPSKHRQWVDGAEREINSYTEADRALIEEAIRERMGVNSESD